MYYESRDHTLTEEPVSLEEACRLVKTGTIMSYRIPWWRNSAGQRVGLVDDSYIDCTFSEVAVINLDTMRQLESITFAWCETVEKCQTHVAACQDSAGYRTAALTIDGVGQERTSTFTCSCCGTGFKSTLKLQRKYDQDSGYGYCDPCRAQFQLGEDTPAFDIPADPTPVVTPFTSAL